MVTNLLLSLGLTRDSKVWIWAQILAVAGMVAPGGADLIGLGAWLGIPVSVVWAHRIAAVAAALLFLGGRYGNSPLPGSRK